MLRFSLAPAGGHSLVAAGLPSYLAAGTLGAQALGCMGSAVTRLGFRARAPELWLTRPFLRGMWALPGPGIKPTSPALAQGFFTTGPPLGHCFFYLDHGLLTILPVFQFFLLVSVQQPARFCSAGPCHRFPSRQPLTRPHRPCAVWCPCPSCASLSPCLLLGPFWHHLSVLPITTTRHCAAQPLHHSSRRWHCSLLPSLQILVQNSQHSVKPLLSRFKIISPHKTPFLCFISLGAQVD